MSPSSAPASRSPDSLLPLKPVETLILLMLSAGERHGYGIRQEILDHSSGTIELEAAHLYRHIRRLESENLVAAAARARAPAGDDPRRIYYRLTPFGRRVLAAEMFRLRALVRLAEARQIIPASA
ncbi:MAG TPA: PadR family transcriptional regulator [Gemmatimonadaceae bacterium]|nr:PadR family transcriptional regulator [Gemmatimonadaceae bacterium]